MPISRNNKSVAQHSKNDKSDRLRSSRKSSNSKLQYKMTYMHVEDHKSPIFCVQFNYFVRGISVFACVGSNRITIYECLLNGKLKFLQVYADPDVKEQFFTCAWSYTHDKYEPLLAAAGFCGIIRIISTKTMNCVNHFTGHGGEINELKFHPTDCNLLLSGSKDYSIRLWNIKTSVCIAVFGGVEGHRDGVLSIDFDMNGTQFVSCGIDHAVKFWKLDKPEIRETIQESYRYDHGCQRSFKTHLEHYPDFSTREVHASYTDCIRWFGNFLISKSNDNVLKFWNSTDPNLFHDIECENCDLWFLKFSMDFSQKILALGNRTGKILVWDINTADPTTIQNISLTHPRSTATIRHTGFNREGLILIAVADDGSVWRWDRVL